MFGLLLTLLAASMHVAPDTAHSSPVVARQAHHERSPHSGPAHRERPPHSAPAHPEPVEGREALSYLALGDSYTIGEGVASADRWPMRLAAALHAEGNAVSDPRIIATTGWTTDELAAALDAAEPIGRYGLVSLAIGVNNQYRGRDVDNYRSEFSALLERAIASAGGRVDRVLVLSIPDWGATRFGAASQRDLAQVSRELDAYNTAAREVCAARGVAFVDITPLSRQRGAEDAMLATDGLHPSAAMYAQWTRRALPVARHLLETP